jgi:hypothetical protein
VKVQEVLTENPVALAMLIGRLLMTNLHHAKKIVGAGRPAGQAVLRAKKSISGKAGELKPSREQLEALATQGRRIEDSLNYQRLKMRYGPSLGTKGVKAAKQEMKDAYKEMYKIIKDVPTK